MLLPYVADISRIARAVSYRDGSGVRDILRDYLPHFGEFHVSYSPEVRLGPAIRKVDLSYFQVSMNVLRSSSELPGNEHNEYSYRNTQSSIHYYVSLTTTLLVR